MNSNIKCSLAISMALVLVTSCNTETKEPTTEEEPLKSGILKEYMDTLVTPGNNFMAYVNGTWLKNTEIPDDKSSYGIGYMVHEEAEENVKAIIEESASNGFPLGSDQQKVGDLYASYMDMPTRDSLGVAPLQEEFAKIDSLQTQDDLARYFAYANKYEVATPLALFVYQDFKNPSEYTIYTWQSGLGLPDREYYLKQDARSKDIRDAYVVHIAKMWELAGLENPKEAAQAIMALESQLASKQMEKEKTRDLVSLYHMVPSDSLSAIMPHFNWTGYLEEAGAPNEKRLGVLMMDYTKALDHIINSTSLDTWKTYLKWGWLNRSASQLSKALVDQNFAFYSKELWGTQQQRPMWRRGVSVVNSTLGEVVGKVYVEKHFPPEAKAKMKILVNNLLKAYEQSITDLDWMGPETKAQALDKLHKFTPKIGYPDKWKSYDISIKPKDLFGNLHRAALMEYNREIAKLGQPVDKTEWGMTPQTVNAYYNPTNNEIVFPAAILQPPFFDMEAEDAVNYGAIGAVIGHEIGHGFDDSGSTFDGDGVMRNWWTPQDKEAFEARTANLVAQYDAFEALPDLHVNGTFTLGENIGDLGGLAIALKAYHLSLDGKVPPVMDGYTGDQRVFIGYAQSWRNKMRDEALRTLINTDPHSPPYYRVNGIVRNIPEFYTAFNVKEGDSLYLPPENRVKIW